MKTKMLFTATMLLAVVVFGGNFMSDSIIRTKFLQMMNDEARTLGMTNTFYTSACGLTWKSYSSADDLLTLTIASLKDPRFSEIWSKTEFSAKIGGPSNRTENVVHTFTQLPGWKKWNDTHKFLGGKSGSLWNSPQDNVRAHVMVTEIDGSEYIISLMGMKLNDDPFTYAADIADSITSIRHGGERHPSAALDALAAAGGGYAYSQTNGNDRFISVNGTKPLIPASTSKIMTLHLCLKAISDLDTAITIEASDIQGGSGIKCYPGDIFTLRDALTIMMLPSANTLAEAIGRTVANLN